LFNAEGVVHKIAEFKLRGRKRLNANISKLNKFCADDKCKNAMDVFTGAALGKNDTCDLFDVVYNLNGAGYYQGNPTHVANLQAIFESLTSVGILAEEINAF